VDKGVERLTGEPSTVDPGITDDVPAGYKAWAFGSKAAGVLVFAVGIEMLTRGSIPLAGLLLIAGAAVVLVPASSPDRWGKRFKGR
jgi:hypothetical protein